MTFPDDPQLTNIERPLPELAALRELSSAEHAHPSVRRAIKTRVHRTIQGSGAGRAARNVSPRTFLLAAAMVVTVPGALAATKTGRDWLEQGAALLPWSDAAKGTATKDSATKDSATRNSATNRTARQDDAAQPQRDIDQETRPSHPSPPPASATSATPDTVVSRPEPVTALRLAPSMPVTFTTPTGPAASASDARFVPPPQLQAERRLLESARMALAHADYVTARYWCEQHRTRFTTPVLDQERASIEALIATGESAASNRGSGPK